ncbi:E3 ubiquitin-protein ligase MARCHF7 isoform X2 [Gouania willdenowi]|uniref:E3 ubiquitin-protein ligase MARCHF7 isoform X2 n=1 Tax=Gouania willdenowi TaxID=441366 RepID=UPI0010549CC1|nr:E3 ubiquitin-protein ligase MARCH7 isoform X2 [Gouania willdenowi]
MDSRSKRLPTCLSNARTANTSSTPVSSTSLGSSRMYSRETAERNSRFLRASSPYKADLDKPSSRLMSSSRDYSSSDSRSPSWKLPSLSSSSRSYDRPWADSSFSSRNKPTDADWKLGMRSSLLASSDDGDTKRAKMSYDTRGLYSRAASASATGSIYTSNGRNHGRNEKQNDLDSSWSSSRLHPRPSSSSFSRPSMSRTEQDTKEEARLSGLGDRRVRSPGPGSALYRTERISSIHAQGARPKDSTYSSISGSSSSSAAARENFVNRPLSSSTSQRTSSLVQDYSRRIPPRFLSGSSSVHPSKEHPRNPESSSYYSCYSAPSARRETTLPPRPAPEGAEQDGRNSTCRLLSRLFTRRSSGSSSVCSPDNDSTSPGADRDEGVRKSAVDFRGSEITRGTIRNRRAEPTPVDETGRNGQCGGPARPRMALWRESDTSSNSSSSSSNSSTSRNSSTSSNGSTIRNSRSSSNGAGSGPASWLPSSLRGRCPPLLSRLRRYAGHEDVDSNADEEEDCVHPLRLLRRWDHVEPNSMQGEEEEEEDDDDDDDDEDVEEEGAVGLEALAAGSVSRQENDALPNLEDCWPHHRLFDALSASGGARGGMESTLDKLEEKSTTSQDQEKLRKIKERLLMEDSDDEDGDQCRICQMGEQSSSDPLIQPCRCTGSLQYVHQECIKRWLRSKVGSGTNLEAITTCELCKEKLRLDIHNFDIEELYRTHNSEYDEFISSGLYLVVLLHFYEQRFSDVLGSVDTARLFNLARILHERMDILESPTGESDEDTRPSVDFSDLDDDLDEY